MLGEGMQMISIATSPNPRNFVTKFVNAEETSLEALCRRIRTF